MVAPDVSGERRRGLVSRADRMRLGAALCRPGDRTGRRGTGGDQGRADPGARRPDSRAGSAAMAEPDRRPGAVALSAAHAADDLAPRSRHSHLRSRDPRAIGCVSPPSRYTEIATSTPLLTATSHASELFDIVSNYYSNVVAEEAARARAAEEIRRDIVTQLTALSAAAGGNGRRVAVTRAFPPQDDPQAGNRVLNGNLTRIGRP